MNVKVVESKIISVLFLAAAVPQWISYEYPDTAPFWPGVAFAPGMIGQVVHWIIVCILATTGVGFWKSWQIRA